MVPEKPRVLLVDDERFARQLYSDYLTGAGCEVEAAESAHVARALFEPGRFQLVVTDLLLPDSDGLEILAEVKRRDPEVDVIVITGLDRVDPAVRAMRGGASDYLVKPVTAETLRLSVARCLSMRRVMAENAQLKTSLSLLEASQRISAATDRARLAEALMPALLAHANARAGFFLSSTGGTFEIVRADGVSDEDQEAAFVALSAGPLAHYGAHGALVFDALPGTDSLASIAGLCTTLVPLRADDASLGAVVLWGEGVPAPSALRGIEFLAGSGAVALATLQRFAHAERLAYIDDLTRLFNSRYLQTVLDRATGERGGGEPFALLFLDLDRFKQVNDEYGHLVGSKLLIEVGRVLKGCVRDRDVCARYGGDEFCVVLAGATRDEALAAAERIRHAIAEHRFLAREGRCLEVTASIGVACWPEHARDKTALLELADQAMYRGKRGTRNTIYLATSVAA